MNETPMRLAIADLDGTLVDTKEINFRAYSDALARHGYSIDYEFFCRFCNGRHYKDFIPGIVPDTTLFHLIHEDKKAAYGKYLHLARSNRTLVALLETLKAGGWIIALVTTASRRNCHELLEHTSLLGLFDIIITREDVTKSKPDPEGFFKAMELAGVSPDNTLIFEDSAPGLEAAFASGATSFTANGFN